MITRVFISHCLVINTAVGPCLNDLTMPRTPLAPVAHQNVPTFSAEKPSRDDDDSSPGGEMSIEETVTIINELSALLQKDDGGSPWAAARSLNS